MLFNLFIWRAENPARADKSAPTDDSVILLRHGSKALDTFMLVLQKHCQAGLTLFEPRLKVIIALSVLFLLARTSQVVLWTGATQTHAPLPTQHIPETKARQ